MQTDAQIASRFPGFELPRWQENEDFRGFLAGFDVPHTTSTLAVAAHSFKVTFISFFDNRHLRKDLLPDRRARRHQQRYRRQQARTDLGQPLRQHGRRTPRQTRCTSRRCAVPSARKTCTAWLGMPSGAAMLENFTRLENFGTPSIHWVEVTVDASDPNVFGVTQRIVKGNLFPR